MTIKYFRKKPVVVPAIQWTGNNLREVISFTDGPPANRTEFLRMKWDEYCDLVARDGLKIFTLEGKMSANVGDWILKGLKGEHWPCKKDIFDLTYDEINGEDANAVQKDVISLEAAMDIIEKKAKDDGSPGLIYWVDNVRKALLPKTVRPPVIKDTSREIYGLSAGKKESQK